MLTIRRLLLVGLVSLLVVALSVSAGVAITALYHQADQRRQAQMQLGLWRRDLSNL